MTVLLGCIADDFTGGTDLAGMLVKAGMRTVQMIGVPQEPIGDDIDAVVIALKSRTNPVEDAIAESLAALRWLQGAGCLAVPDACSVRLAVCGGGQGKVKAV